MQKATQQNQKLISMNLKHSEKKRELQLPHSFNV